MNITNDFLIFLYGLDPTPFHDSVELIETATRLTREWIRFCEDWGISDKEILAPFDIEDVADIAKSELPGLILVHLLVSLGIELNEILFLKCTGLIK